MDFITSLFKESEPFDYENKLLNDRGDIEKNINKNYEESGFQEVKTTWDIFKFGLKSGKENVCLGKRKLDDEGKPHDFVFENYSEVGEKVRNFACGIEKLLNVLEENGSMAINKNLKNASGKEIESEILENIKIQDLRHYSDNFKNTLKQSTTKKKIRSEDNSKKSPSEEGHDEKNEVNECARPIKNPECVGIYSENRPEWFISALGMQLVKICSVPLYDSLGKNAASHIINESGIRVVVASKAKIPNMISAIKEGKMTLRVIIQMDYNELYNNKKEFLCPKQKKELRELGVSLLAFNKILELGSENIVNFDPTHLEEEDRAFIMYTSGTSGDPKGVILSHKNIVSRVLSIQKTIDVGKKKCFLSYLPLAHIFECVIEYTVLICSSGIGYYSGTPKMIPEDILALKPNFLIGVPRIFDRMYGRVMKEINLQPFYKKIIAQIAYRYGVKQNREHSNVSKPSFMDSLIWSTVRRRMGMENVEIVVTGGAPCPNHIMEFLRVLFPCPVLEGYGMTETSGIVTVYSTHDANLGHVGFPFGTQIKLIPVPDTDYNPEGLLKRGEICIKGDGLFKGYFKKEEKTKEVMTDDGWFCTGDVGRFNPNGTISIIDRKKSIFKLSQGEYISPESVESVYLKSAAVNQIYVFGDSKRNFLVAVVVPKVRWSVNLFKRKEDLLDVDEKLMLKSMDSDILGEKKTREAMKILGGKLQKTARAEIMAELKPFDSELRRFESIHGVHVEFEVDADLNGFNITNGCLTPSLKLRRTFLKRRYTDHLETLYRELLNVSKDE